MAVTDIASGSARSAARSIWECRARRAKSIRRTCATCAPKPPDCIADFRDLERLFRAFLHYPAKPVHDDRMLALRHAVLAIFAVVEAADHGFRSAFPPAHARHQDWR
jgi:hypothetical protein